MNRLHTLLIAASSLTAGAQTSAPPLDRIDVFVNSELQRQKIPGVAVALVRRGELLAANGYGFANVEHRIAVTSETIFQSGSVGKQFTSAAVMLLVEDGLVTLEDPISKFFPDAPATWQAIRVRHLLTHTSGIPDYTTDAMDYRRDYSEAELAKMAYGLTLEFEPGSRWNYSNTGYVLLGTIIRKVSGRFYGDILKDRVFAPLGMKTARVISEEDIVTNRAAGYRLVNGQLKNQEWVAPQLNTTADGALYLTVNDLVAWDKGLRAKAVLKPESWARVFTPVTLNSGKTYPYGFGWSVAEDAGQPTQQHGGAWQGFQAYIARYLTDDLTIIVLANLSGANTERIVQGIGALVNPAFAPKPLARIDDREPAVTARIREILASAAEGKLSPNDFAYVRAGFFPNAAARYARLLQPLGTPQRLDLLERKELGDDRVYQYEVAFATRTLILQIGLAPGNRVSQFSMRPR
ncbi:MAG: serine hydrolase domain-containing protein [Gemmatimonadaceae bacterium]